MAAAALKCFELHFIALNSIPLLDMCTQGYVQGIFDQNIYAETAQACHAATVTSNCHCVGMCQTLLQTFLRLPCGMYTYVARALHVAHAVRPAAQAADVTVSFLLLCGLAKLALALGLPLPFMARQVPSPMRLQQA